MTAIYLLGGLTVLLLLGILGVSIPTLIMVASSDDDDGQNEGFRYLYDIQLRATGSEHINTTVASRDVHFNLYPGSYVIEWRIMATGTHSNNMITVMLTSSTVVGGFTTDPDSGTTADITGSDQIGEMSLSATNIVGIGVGFCGVTVLSATTTTAYIGLLPAVADTLTYLDYQVLVYKVA